MPDAPGFNACHADVAKSAACDLIFQQALGLPSDMVSNSLLTWAGIAEVAAALGLDFSAVAVAIAARRTGPRGHARFCVADFTAIGLRDHSADAVMCIDAIQFSDPPLTALGECRRILASGGRLAVTAWEPTGPFDARLPERIRRMNLAAISPKPASSRSR